MDDLLVLRTFSHDVDMDGNQVQSFEIVFSSRKMFSNVKCTLEDQEPDEVLGVSDGTYKIHYGGWTLVNFGTYSTRYVRGGFAKHYVPWAFLFVRTEHTEAYRELFATTVRCARLFFGLELSFSLESLDHAACIANAIKSTWP
ncbi:hypothetical protein DVH05_027815 [Phytophthora capsici]|nr:hypothetical protein DVH05_027815 [Phytophthora capsici]